MKNLKKVLALGLALVMLLGMFTVASAAETEEKKLVASDFTDFDTVADNHKDAVSLAVDLGIIKGIATEDGKFAFAPNAPIDRASWAKIVYFLCEGREDAEEYRDDNSPIKDAKSSWAEDYICYLAGTGIISGDENGYYRPTANVTVVEAYKMVLTTLGFHAELEGYQNHKNWRGNIEQDARKVGLKVNIDKSLGLSDPLTRENAAELLYNALGVNKREANVKSYGQFGDILENYDIYDETLGYLMFGLVKVNATVSGIAEGGATLKGAKAYGIALDARNLKVVNEKIPASDKVIGQNVTLFAKGNLDYVDGELESVTLKELVSTSLAAGKSNVLLSSAEGVNLNKAIDSSEKDAYVADVDSKITVYMDGVSTEVSSTDGKVANWGTNVADEAKKVGNLVELIDNDGNDAIDTVKITTYEVVKISGDLETRTKSDVEEIRLKGAINTWTAASKVTGYADLKKDDIVLKSTNNVVTTLEKADKVTGKVTWVENKAQTITVADGEAYIRSEIKGLNTAGCTNFAEWKDRSNEFDFYLDKAGAICYTVQLTEEVTTDVAYILRTTWVETSSGDIFNTSKSGVGKAEILFTDGSSETVDVVKVVKSVDADGKVTYMEEEEMKTTLQGTDLVGFAEVSEGSKGWTVSEIKENVVDVTGKVTAAPKFNGENSADLNTVFLIGKGPDDDGNYAYAAYTGYKGIPGMQEATGCAYTANGGAADYVYLTAESFDGDAPEGYVYIKDATDYGWADADTKSYAIVDAEGNSEKTTLKVAGDVDIATGLYEIKAVDENGVVTAVEAVTVDQDVTASGAGVFTAGSKTVSYDDATVCVVIDLDAEGAFVEANGFTPDDLDISLVADEGNFTSVKAVIIGEENAVASYIYVIRTAPAAE